MVPTEVSIDKEEIYFKSVHSYKRVATRLPSIVRNFKDQKRGVKLHKSLRPGFPNNRHRLWKKWRTLVTKTDEEQITGWDRCVRGLCEKNTGRFMADFIDSASHIS